MSELIEQPDVPGKPKCPEFQAKFFWAFVALLLYKTGGVEIVTQEQLEKFSLDDLPEVIYDHDHQVWVMRLKKDQGPKKNLVHLPNKIRKKMPKVMWS